MAHPIHGFVKRRDGTTVMYKPRNGHPDGSQRPLPRRVYGLYQCLHEGCFTRWNRDKNAAINIWHIFNDTARNGAPHERFTRAFAFPEGYSPRRDAVRATAVGSVDEELSDTDCS